MVIRKSSDINNLDDYDEHPPAKRMKIIPFDCKVILGTERYEYQCYLWWLSFQSDLFEDGYELPQEGDPLHTFEFPDVSPRVWGLMMHLTDFSDGGDLNRVSNISDLMQVIEKCQKYRFHKALTACDMLVSKTFKAFSKKLHSNPLFAVQRMNKLIDLAVVCDRVDLDGSKAAIGDFFRRALALPEGGRNRPCGFIYKKKQVKRLAPLIAKERLLGDRWTPAEIVCPLFPQVYLATLSEAAKERRLRIIQNKASIKGTVVHSPGGQEDYPKAQCFYEMGDDVAKLRLMAEFGDDPTSPYYLGP